MTKLEDQLKNQPSKVVTQPQIEETLLDILTHNHSIHKHLSKTITNIQIKELVKLDTNHGFINFHTRLWTQLMDTEAQLELIMDGIHQTHTLKQQLTDHMELIQ